MIDFSRGCFDVARLGGRNGFDSVRDVTRRIDREFLRLCPEDTQMSRRGTAGNAPAKLVQSRKKHSPVADTRKTLTIFFWEFCRSLPKLHLTDITYSIWQTSLQQWTKKNSATLLSINKRPDRGGKTRRTARKTHNCTFSTRTADELDYIIPPDFFTPL